MRRPRRAGGHHVVGGGTAGVDARGAGARARGGSLTRHPGRNRKGWAGRSVRTRRSRPPRAATTYGGKPAPKPAEHALEPAGVPAERAVPVGDTARDTARDTRAGAEAGVRRLGVPCGGAGPAEAGAEAARAGPRRSAPPPRRGPPTWAFRPVAQVTDGSGTAGAGRPLNGAWVRTGQCPRASPFAHRDDRSAEALWSLSPRGDRRPHPHSDRPGRESPRHGRGFLVSGPAAPSARRAIRRSPPRPASGRSRWWPSWHPDRRGTPAGPW
ncbi:HAD hydrolase-like protein [Streptomyces malaysiense]|uniref:HAD hydrolase-like protein n=1 Tax=Streptomyces malaysiense TaxID=1428626 RepID=UPI0030B84B80